MSSAGDTPLQWRRAREPSRTSVLIAKDILRRVHEDGMAPGDPLPPEGEMARQYGVGKGAIREALLILELNGFVTVRAGAGGGPVVSDGGSASFGQMASMHFQHKRVVLGELLQARVALEPFVARIAADWQDPARMNELRAVMEESETVDVTDSRAYLSCADRFHLAIASLSGNRVLDLYGAAIIDLYNNRLPGTLAPPASRARVMREHVEIGRAIVSGDGAAAEAQMRVHMEHLQAEIAERRPSFLEEPLEWR